MNAALARRRPGVQIPPGPPFLVFPRFIDIINSIDDMESSAERLTFEDFIKDRKTINAVIRSIEVIGDPSSRRFREIYVSETCSFRM
jgi:hypothetical protein